MMQVEELHYAGSIHKGQDSRTEHPAAIPAQIARSNQCRALGFIAIGNAPVLELCRILIGASFNPDQPHYLHARNFAASAPLSGSAGGSFIGDITIPLLGRNLCVQVKVCTNVFCRLYHWLADRDLLILRADRRDPPVIAALRLAPEVATAAEQAKFLRQAKIPTPRARVHHRSPRAST